MFLQALEHAARQRIPETGQRYRCPCPAEIDKLAVKPECREYNSGGDVYDKYSRRGKLRLIDEYLPYDAQHASYDESSEIIHVCIRTPFTRQAPFWRTRSVSDER